MRFPQRCYYIQNVNRLKYRSCCDYIFQRFQRKMTFNRCLQSLVLCMLCDMWADKLEIIWRVNAKTLVLLWIKQYNSNKVDIRVQQYKQMASMSWQVFTTMFQTCLNFLLFETKLKSGRTKHAHIPCNYNEQATFDDYSGVLNFKASVFIVIARKGNASACFRVPLKYIIQF